MEINGSAAAAVKLAVSSYAQKQAQQTDQAAVLALLQGVPAPAANLQENPPNLGRTIDAWA
ncbi:hypothetical protein ACFOLG_03970 [Vogesella facilis]|uniref:Motility protein n=1 Tax=Vogesella facilis TaxID=1655232 RepID=A0ABV7RDP5_9NEIS